MLFLAILPSITVLSVNPDTKVDKAFKNGIIFHEDSKILLGEKFVNVEFLVPFPRHNFTLKTEIGVQLQILEDMWKLPSAACPLDFSYPFTSTQGAFNLNWMVVKI